MVDPSMQPTAADYANSAAQDAKSEVEKLKKQVKDLERNLEYLRCEVAEITRRLE